MAVATVAVTNFANVFHFKNLLINLFPNEKHSQRIGYHNKNNFYNIIVKFD